MNLSKVQVKPIKKEVELLGNFEETNLGYTTLELAKEEAERCLHCPHAPCMKACPAHNHIPDFIKQIKNRNGLEANKILRITTIFSSICGRVCPHEKQCESVCVRARNGEAVAIRNLERFASTFIVTMEKPKEERKERIAIIGAGPAGLMCAYRLRTHGYQVDIYDENPKAGGALTYSIPSFRLPYEEVEKVVKNLEGMGVHFFLNHKIEGDLETFITDHGYQKMVVATGATKDKYMHLPGENLENVWPANALLIKAKKIMLHEIEEELPLKNAKKVVVIGGGNTAMDAASYLRRLGVEVIVMYRRSEEEMPANKEELEEAKKEGIQFMFLTNPNAFLGEKEVSAISFVHMELLDELDKSGRKKCREKPNSQENLQGVGGVVTAISASSNIEFIPNAFDMSSWGSIVVNDEGQTSNDQFYAGGDVVTGPLTVVHAMKAGDTIAESIHQSFNQ